MEAVQKTDRDNVVDLFNCSITHDSVGRNTATAWIAKYPYAMFPNSVNTRAFRVMISEMCTLLPVGILRHIVEIAWMEIQAKETHEKETGT